MGSSNDNLSNEEKFIIDFRIRHQWNIRTKTQLLFKLFIWAILTNWWISDKAGPFWRQLPTPANALRPTYINHYSWRCLKGVNYLVMSKRGQLSCDVQKKPFLWKRRRGWISDGPYGHDQVICLPRMNSFGGGKHSCHPFRRLAIPRCPF